MQIHSTACPRNCYSTCSFKVYVENGKISNIAPNPANKATPEGICLKGLAYVERANSPERILYPLLKNKNGIFERITWDVALDLISSKLNYYKKNFGSHSVLFYAASGMSGLTNGFSSNFWKLYGGTTRVYGNLCWPAGLEATRLTLGENKHNAPWDLENAKLILLWGKNAAETNIQQTIFIDKALENGAKLIVIDPRRTPSSDRADYLFQIKPGTDAALALAVANILIKNKWYDSDFINKYVLGFDEFAEKVKNYTTEKVAKITEIPEKYIEILAELIAKQSPMTIIPGYGMQRYTNGGQTIRAILALSVLTGNIGKKGACFHYANLQSYVFDDVKEPVNYYPSATNDFPFRRSIATAKLGVDMLATKNPELKMLWCERANPVTQNPDTNNVLKAIRNLEFRVVVEQFMTDTAKEADIILPAKNMFEQSDIIGSYWNPYIQLKPKVVEPAGEVKPETEIYWHLAKRMNFSEKEIAENLLEPNNEAVESFLKETIKKYPELDWEKLKEAPQLANNHEEIAFSDFIFPTPSGKIELFSLQAKELWNIDELPDYVELIENDKTSTFSFQLLTPNTKNRIHSQFGNLNVIKQFEPEAFAEINAKDAFAKKINDGDEIEVFNARGAMRVKARLSFGIKSGCISISNGWWIENRGSLNSLSAPRETDIGHGTAFHDNRVDFKRI